MIPCHPCKHLSQPVPLLPTGVSSVWQQELLSHVVAGLPGLLAAKAMPLWAGPAWPCGGGIALMISPLGQGIGTLEAASGPPECFLPLCF